MKRLAFLLFVLACAMPTEPKQTVGRWRGEVQSVQFDMNLAIRGTEVSIDGVLGTPLFGVMSLTGKGVYTDPTLSATLYPGPYQPFNLTASFQGDSLAGRLNGSGFENVPITFHK